MAIVAARSGVIGALTKEHREQLTGICSAGRGSSLPVAGTWGPRPAAPVRAYEFDAAAVHVLCGTAQKLKDEVCTHVSGVFAGRLMSARVRLLDPYAPYGAGEVP